MGELLSRSGDLFRDGMSGGWIYSVEVGDGLSDAVPIPPTGRGSTNGTVVLVCGASTAKIQTTIDPLDGNEVWIDWDKGVVTGTVSDVFDGPIAAIKAVSISGSIMFKILI